MCLRSPLPPLWIAPHVVIKPLEVTTTEQEIVRLAFVGQDEYYYPTPEEGATVLCDDDGWITWANKLLPHQLPSASHWRCYGEYMAGTDIDNPIPVGSLMDDKSNIITTEDGKSINRNH